jgi:ATP-dependent RNA helicase RhlE
MFGGVGPGPQVEAFRRSVDVIIATPGRLLDHQRRGLRPNSAALEYLVLDEADRMLDMGFLPDVRRVLAQLPKNRQTLFFSATLPKPIVEALARDAQGPGAHQRRARLGAGERASSRRLWPVSEALKAHLLIACSARRPATSSASRAPSTAPTASPTCSTQRGDPERPIHGNRSQNQRTEALGRLQGGQGPGARRHRHRRARHRRGGARDTS